MPQDFLIRPEFFPVWRHTAREFMRLPFSVLKKHESLTHHLSYLVSGGLVLWYLLYLAIPTAVATTSTTAKATT